MSKYLVFYLEIFLILVIPIILFMKDSQFLASRPIVMASILQLATLES